MGYRGAQSKRGPGLPEKWAVTMTGDQGRMECWRGPRGESQTQTWISRVLPRESDILAELLKASRGYLV